MTETITYRKERARAIAGMVTDGEYWEQDTPFFAAILLCTGTPSDRALDGWVPYLWASQPRPVGVSSRPGAPLPGREDTTSTQRRTRDDSTGAARELHRSRASIQPDGP